MKPKVLFVHNTLIDYRLPLFRELNKKLDITFLITREDKKNIKRSKDLKDIKFELIPHFKLFSKYGIAWPIIFKLIFKKYDIIITTDPHIFETYITFFISKLFLRKKFIIWTETFHWPRSPKSKLVLPLIKLMFRTADACVAVGSKSKEYFLSLGTSKNQLFIAPDTSLTHKIYNYEEYKSQFLNKTNIKNKKIILYLSRIVSYKGLDYLVKAFAKLEKERDDIFLLIVGDGPFKKEIKDLIKDLKVKNVYFAGWADKNERGFYYSLADVFVLPSTFRDYDADCWGLVLNEAMALGLPVISTTAVGGAYDLIKNEINGYRIKHGNVNELYDALKEIISNKRLRDEMGKESKKIIKTRFTYKKMAQGFYDAIISTINN